MLGFEFVRPEPDLIAPKMPADFIANYNPAIRTGKARFRHFWVFAMLLPHLPRTFKAS
jgi:hypothetical protein